jgi:hypothetical protein
MDILSKRLVWVGLKRAAGTFTGTASTTFDYVCRSTDRGGTNLRGPVMPIAGKGRAADGGLQRR